MRDLSGYEYPDSRCTPAHAYLLPAVRDLLAGLRLRETGGRIIDLGCGNGAVAAELARDGYDLCGVDPSEEGIRRAQEAHPDLAFHRASTRDPLADRFGTFRVVLSLEVVEHVYFPRRFAACVAELLEEGGTAIISTPYHGYLKNLAIALFGKMDDHFTALWTHGHIKFWSRATLSTLLSEAGLDEVAFRRVGRVPPLAKSMIATAVKPSAEPSLGPDTSSASPGPIR